MRVNGFQCDACCKIGNDNEFKGWLFVRDHETNSGYREHHFCSLHCLHDWVEKQMPANDIELPFEVDVPRVGIDLGGSEVNEYWRDL